MWEYNSYCKNTDNNFIPYQISYYKDLKHNFIYQEDVDNKVERYVRREHWLGSIES